MSIRTAPRSGNGPLIRLALLAAIAVPSLVAATTVQAQQDNWWENQSRREPAPTSRQRRNDAYRPAETGPGLGALPTDAGRAPPVDDAAPANPYPQAGTYNAPPPSYARAPQGYPHTAQAPYNPGPAARRGADDAYRPPAQGAYGGGQPGPYDAGPAGASSQPGGYVADDGFGQPYAAPLEENFEPRDAGPPRRHRGDGRAPYRDQGEAGDRSFSSREIVAAGHSFFGSVSQGMASVIEYAFQRQGRPNGYILGEDVGGAFVAGLRYGEGVLYTRDAGSHKVYWQGPSLGYDVGAEGSKVMVLVYNLRDPGEIYDRFGGVAGSAYVVGGVGVTFQARDHLVLAPIRSGVGLRLGANVGYLKYTSRPTWNPF